MVKETIITVTIVISIIAAAFVMMPYQKKRGTTEAKSCVVVGCTETEDYFEVTIRDHEGNEWAYYDDNYMPNGYLLRAVWKGNEIVNVQY